VVQVGRYFYHKSRQIGHYCLIVLGSL
jgi:hypothetical protein